MKIKNFTTGFVNESHESFEDKHGPTIPLFGGYTDEIKSAIDKYEIKNLAVEFRQTEYSYNEAAVLEFMQNKHEDSCTPEICKALYEHLANSYANESYKSDVKKYKFFVVDLAAKTAVSGWEYQSDAKDALDDYDGDKNFRISTEAQLKTLGVENPKEKWMNESVNKIDTFNVQITNGHLASKVIELLTKSNTRYSDVDNKFTVYFAYEKEAENLKNDILKIDKSAKFVNESLSDNSENFVNECVVAVKIINGDHVLVKNRDRNYTPKVEIVHEVVDGVEVMYMHDLLTGWCEGLNEYGVSIVNSALMVDADERAIELAADNTIHQTYDGHKIIDALKAKTARGAINRLIKANYKEFGKSEETGEYPGMLAGHTIVCDNDNTYHFECDGENYKKRKVKLDDENKFVAYTNHGDQFEDLGYQEGFARKSSETRKALAEEVLSKSLRTNQLLSALADGFKTDPRLNPFRGKPERGNRLFTTAQIALNSEKLRLTFRYNDDICEFAGVRVNLGDREPTIKLILKTI